jgi:hypothetical protein
LKTLIGLIAAVAMLLVAAMPVAAAHEAGHEAGGGDKVTLCHATNSFTNPFVAIQVDASGNVEGHKADDGNFHVNEKTGLQDFLLSTRPELQSCDQAEAELVAVTPLAPAVSAPTCVAPGILTTTAVTGIVYTITPAPYTPGVSTGTFTVTAAADTEAGFTLAAGAPTIFPNLVVPAQLVCGSDVQGGTGGPVITPVTPVVRGGTLANTATDQPSTPFALLLGTLLLGAGVVSMGAMVLSERRFRI